MALGFSTNEVIVRCSQEDLHKLREDCNVTWMMYLSKTNQEQYGHRNTQAKTTAFLFEMCLLAGIYMHKNPPYMCTSLHHLCLTKRLLAYHLPLFPMKFPKNAMNQRSLYQFLVAKVRSGILYMKHLKDFRRNLFGRLDESSAKISPKDPI